MSTEPSPQHTTRRTQPWPATDALITEFTPAWLRGCGFDTGVSDLEAFPSLDDKTQRLGAMRVLAHLTCMFDASTFASMSELLGSVPRHDRAHLVSIVGQLATEAWQGREGRVTQVVAKAAEEQHVAHSMIMATRERLGRRHTEPGYTSWLTTDPDGLAKYAWQASLRVAGERLWDRNWAKIAGLGAIPSRLEAYSSTPLKYQPGVLRLRKATNMARSAAVASLIAAATSDDSGRRAHAWDQAVDAARHAEGAQPWAADADATRAGVGEAAWTAANQSARATVQVVVNELPHVVGRIALLALAGETCEAALRAAAIREAGTVLQKAQDSTGGYDAGHEAVRVAMLDLSA